MDLKTKVLLVILGSLALSLCCSMILCLHVTSNFEEYKEKTKRVELGYTLHAEKEEEMLLRLIKLIKDKQIVECSY